MSTDDLKLKLLDALRIVKAMGLFEGNAGHVSLRVPGTNDILIQCHMHEEGQALTFDRLKPEHIVRLHLADHTWENELGLDPPDEYWIHTAIYDARPEIAGVVHTHPLMPTSLSMADVTVKPMHHTATLIAPEVPIMDYHLQISDRQSSEAMVAAMGTGFAVVLRAHGLVTCGRSVEEAVTISRIVDESARRQYIAAQVGKPRPIEVKERAWELGNESIHNTWEYFLHLAREAAHA